MILFLATVFAIVLASPAEAGPVGAAIVGIVKAVGTWAAASAVNAFIVNTALSIGASILSAALAKKNQPANNGGLIVDRPTKGDTTPGNVILGHYATPGNYTAPPYTHGNVNDIPNAFMTMVRDMADMPVAGFVHGLWINDDWVPLKEEPDSPLFPGFYRPIEGSKYEGEVWVKYYDGTQTEADPHLINCSAGSVRPWSSDMIGRGIPYWIVIIENHPERMPSEPDLLFEVYGSKLYDPRKDSSVGGVGPHRYNLPETHEFSENPIVQAYNVARGIRLPDGDYWGGGISEDGLPLDNWFAGMNKCDVPRDSDGEPTYRSSYNILIGPEEFGGHEPAGVIEELLLAASASIAEVSGGVWHVRVGPPDLPVAIFSDGDLIGDENEVFDPFPGIDEIYNAVQSQHPDPNMRWAPRQLPTRYSPEYEAEDQNERLVANISFPAVIDGEQVQYLMQSMLDDGRRMRRHELTLPPDYAHITPLDTMAYASERAGYSAKLFEVNSRTGYSRNLNSRFSVRERDPDDYSWSGDFVLPTPLYPVHPDEVPTQFGTPGENWDGYIIVDHNNLPRAPGAIFTWTLPNPGDIIGISWQVATLGDAIVVASNTTQDVTAGELVITEGIRTNVQYQGRSKVEAPGRVTAWGAWYPFVSPNVGLDWRDIEIDVTQDFAELENALIDIDGRVAENEALLDQLASDATAEAAAVRQLLADERQALLNEAALIRQEIETAETDLGEDMDDLETLLRGEIGTAVTTGIETYDLVVQGQFESIAGQIESLTAVLSSADLLINGSFADGALTGWTAINGTPAVLTREGNSNTNVAAAPTPYVMELGPSEEAGQTTATFSLTANDRFRIRFSGAAGNSTASNRIVRVSATWLDGQDVQIGTTETTNFTMPQNLWGVYTHEFDPPDNAVKAAISLRHMGASGNQFFTSISANTADTSVEASVIQLQGALADLDSAFATYQTQANARFGTVEASVTSEAGARATADTALSGRVDTVETNLGTTSGLVTQHATAISGLEGSLASLSTSIDATFGNSQLVRDPDFTNDLTYWPTGNLGNASNIVARDKASSDWKLRDMPGRKAWRVDNGTGSAIRGTEAFPVTPGEKFDIGAWVGRDTGGPTVSVTIRWLDASGTNTGTAATLTATPPEGAWGYVTLGEAEAPATARQARLQIARSSNGAGPGSSYVTGLFWMRWAATEHLSKSNIKTVADAVADLEGAFTTYQTTINARFGTNETAISNEITARSNADSALGLRIDTVETTVEGNTTNISTMSTSLSNLVTAMATLETNVSAAFGDTQLVRDPDFNDDLTYWSLGSLGNNSRIITRDSASLSWHLATMPGRKAFELADNMSGKRHSPPFNVSPAEIFDVGFYYGKVGNGPRVRVSVEWLASNSPSATVLSQSSLEANPTQGAYQYFSIPNLSPPGEARAARIVFERSQNGNGGLSYLTKITMRRREEYERAATAEISSATTVATNAAGALAQYITNNNSRVGDVEATIGVNEITRVKQGGAALGALITNLQTAVGNNASAITTTQTALTTAQQSLANISSEVATAFNRSQVVRDPDFNQGLVHWGVGQLGGASHLVARNANDAAWQNNSMPGRYAFRWHNGNSAVGEIRRSANFPVVEGEVFDIEAWVARQAGSSNIFFYIQFFREDGTWFPASGTLVAPTAGSWQKISREGIEVPAGAVAGAVGFQRQNSGATSNHWTYITNIRATRRSVFDSLSDARVKTVQQAVADADEALAAYQIESTARFNRFTASGRLRVYNLANFAGGASRIALTAETGEDSNVTTAGLFLESKTDGTSAVYIKADRLALVTDHTNAASRTTPFFIQNGTVYMNRAMIRNADIQRAHIAELAVDTLRIGKDAVTTMRMVTVATTIQGARETIVTPFSADSQFMIFISGRLSVDGGGAAGSATLTVKLNGNVVASESVSTGISTNVQGDITHTGGSEFVIIPVFLTASPSSFVIRLEVYGSLNRTGTLTGGKIAILEAKR